MKYLFTLTWVALCIGAIAQPASKFKLQIHYGAQGNFFVRSYDETQRAGQYFFKKDFIGTIQGIDLAMRVGKRSSLSLGYANSMNKREIEYFNRFVPNYTIGLRDFTIRHINNFFMAAYLFDAVQKKKTNLNLEGGLVYVRPQQQEIDLGYTGALFDERDFENSRLEEGGVYFGINYSRKIDKHFYFGIQSRIFYLISVNIIEAVTLTPTLAYHF